MDKKESLTAGKKQPVSGEKHISLSPWQGMEQEPFPTDLFEWSEADKAGRWSISWADLMMTMFILFVVLYIYQGGSRDLKFGQGTGNHYLSEESTDRVVNMNIRRQPSDIYDQTKAAFRDELVDSSTSVELIPDKAVRIVMAGDLMFDLGRADLKPQALWRLRQLSRLLNKNLYVINVIGYTDDVPNHSRQYPTNWELSTARACSVARFLIEDQGINENRFFVSGYSWHRPIVPNTNAYNRSLNRRVEIVLMKEMPYAKTYSETKK